MPYIAQEQRERASSVPATVGELTYAIQQCLLDYSLRMGASYQTYAECLGAMRGAELDLWDRKLQPYEVVKREMNGDVW